MTYYVITDHAGTSGTVILSDPDQIPAALRPWYPEAPAEVYEQIDALADEVVGRGDRDAATHLGVRVQMVEQPTTAEEWAYALDTLPTADTGMILSEAYADGALFGVPLSTTSSIAGERVLVSEDGAWVVAQSALSGYWYAQ
jgi:hypothetical protein